MEERGPLGSEPPDGGFPLAGRPAGGFPVPDQLRSVIRGRPVRPVWRNLLGGLTFELTGTERLFLKWVPRSSGLDLGAEVARLRWASSYVVVPEVLEHGLDAEGEWMLTRAVPGDNAVTPRWKTDPARAVAAIGEGLRILHDTLPATDCPFSWSVEERVGDAEHRMAAGRLTVEGWRRTRHGHLLLTAALSRARRAPAVDRRVVCHGDACAPNTLVREDGSFSGHVDLGSLGVADRWADLAVATWSTEWNYGAGWEATLLEAYGVEPDPRRTAYYRLLWDLGP